MSSIDHLAEGIYRISVMTAEAPISFNQFLITGDRPALIHTGPSPLQDQVREAMASVLGNSARAPLGLADDLRGADRKPLPSRFVYTTG